MTVTAGHVAGASGAGRQPARPRTRRRGRWSAYLLVAPSVIALLGLFGYPVFLVVRMSFQHLGLRELAFRQVIYVGWDNYRSIFTDPNFWVITGRTFVFALVNVAVTIALGTAIALMLQRLGPRMRFAVTASMILAWAMPVLTAVVVWLWLFDAQYGVVNWIATSLGFDAHGHSYFTSQASTFFVITVIVVWQATPFVAFSLHAGLLGVPAELYEAAEVDGATARQRFVMVTWPRLRPIYLVLTFLSFIWDFRCFTQIWLVRQGGPDGKTVTLPLYLYLQGPTRSNFGVAAAVSVVVVVILGVALSYYIRALLRIEPI